MDNIRSVVNKGKNLAGYATGNLATSVRNMLPDSDSNARPGFAGEKHAILKLPNGKYGVANYMGPGTHLEARLRRGDPPRTLSDKVAMAHDSRYGLAKSQADVAAADRKMIAKLKQIEKTGGDSRWNTQLGMRPIQAKLHAERLGLVKPGTIASFGDVKAGDRALVASKLRALEQEGFGGYPGDRLKVKLLRQMRLNQGRTQSMKLRGRGLPKDMLKQLVQFVSGNILPMLMKKLSGGGLKLAGQGMPKAKLNSLLHMRMLRAMNDGASRNRRAIVGRGIKDVAKKLKPMAAMAAHTLLPLLLSMVEKKLAGSGVPEPYHEFKRRVENPGIIATLGRKLSHGVLRALKAYVSE